MGRVACAQPWEPVKISPRFGYGGPTNQTIGLAQNLDTNDVWESGLMVSVPVAAVAKVKNLGDG